jgi:hypothetical protein
MEQLSPNNELAKLDSDIKLKNAEFLNMLESTSLITMSRHVERAIVIYHFCMHTYENGGEVYGVSESGVETMVPLFDTSNEERDQLVKAHLSLDIGLDVAMTLAKLGVDERSSETTILDNIINTYAHMIEMSYDGYQIVGHQSNGTKMVLNSSDFS